MQRSGLCGLLGLAMVLVAGCGILGGGSAASTPSPPTPAAPAPPTTPPTLASPSPSPSPRPSPSATQASASSTLVYVANTDGQGVYIRKSPVMADRVQAYPDGTALTVVGPDVDGDGQHWKNVKAPDGLDGYVPSIYTDATPP